MRERLKKIPRLSLLVLILALLMGYKANAAPLKNIPTKIIQPNGEEVTCFASGDEFYNWLHDKNGLVIIQDKDTGYYCYGKELKGKLIPSRNIVTNKSIADPNINKASIKGVTINDINVPLSEINKNKALLEKNSKISTPTNEGTLNNLIVFIRFQDEDEFTSPISFYDDMFNKSTENYNSMKNYFKEVSYNKLTVNSTMYPLSPTNSVVSYQDIHPRNYYKAKSKTNPIGYDETTTAERKEREHNLLERAVKAIESQVPANLDIDENNDGYVDNLCFIIKGFPEGWNGLLWPHQWSLSSKNVTLLEKRVYLYNFQLETSLYSDSGVGVLAHEMFHSIGAPDLYHYKFDGMKPVDIWDLMEYNLDPPQHMTAYMKYKYGKWIESIPEITKDGTYTLNPLNSDTAKGVAYKILSPKSQSEYFIVEYRKPEGIFEQSLIMANHGKSYNPKRSGIIVYRINTLIKDGNKNGPPDELYVFRPGGTLEENGNILDANLSKNVNRIEIGGKENPLFFSDGTDSGIYISDIGVAGKNISFKVCLSNESLPYMGWLDTLGDNEILSGIKDISGWLVYGKEINKVEILVDDAVVGVANTYPRPDISQVYPGYMVNKAGFSYKLNTSNLKNGKHNIKIRATGTDKTTHELPAKQIEVKNEILPYMGWLDTPKNGEILSGIKDISGWFIYGKDISKIEVLINGKVVGKARKVARTDVGDSYPGYDVSKCGYVFDLDTTTFSNGIYNLSIKATGIDGTSSELPSRKIEVKNKTLPYAGWIDTPKDEETLSGVRNIGGWLLYGKEVRKIEVYVDNVLIGEATRYERPDLSGVYEGYDVSQAGFNYNLNTTNLKAGKHQLTVKAVGVDSSNYELQLTFSTK